MSRVSIDSNDSNSKRSRGGSNVVEKYLAPYAQNQIEDNEISDRMLERYQRIKIQTNCECGNILMRHTLTNKTNCGKCKKNIEVNEVIFACPQIDKKPKH
eukprot:175516_1